MAFERGPIVYCAEGVDNGGKALNLIVPDSMELKYEWRSEILKSLPIILGVNENQKIILIPYHLWAHRGQGEMAVWLKRG